MTMSSLTHPMLGPGSPHIVRQAVARMGSPQGVRGPDGALPSGLMLWP